MASDGMVVRVLVGSCPCCGVRLVIVVEAKDWTKCQGCEREFRVNEETGVEVKLSEAERESIAEWERLSHDIENNPADYVPCWKDDCEDGFEVVKGRRGVSIVQGLCIECDGQRFVRRP